MPLSFRSTRDLITHCRTWLFVVALLPILLLAGCDQQSPEPFSVEVRVETQQGEPVQDVSVGVRPCYGSEGEAACGDGPVFSGARVGTASKRASSVELVFWTVERDGNAALLRWTTASETNNDRFLVERKTGNGTFTEIGDVEGAGTTEDSTEYSFRDADPSRTALQHTYRLIAVATDGTTSVAGEPQSVLIPVESEILSIFPNPLRDNTILRVTAGTTSTLRSTLYTLDGAQAETLVNSTVALGRHELLLSPKDIPDGLYELRTRIGTDGEIAVGDTTYAAIRRGLANAAPLGTTGEDGRVSTTARVRFPSLFDVPAFEARDAEGNRLGEIRVASTVQFVVTTSNGRQTYRRSIADGKNTVTLTVSP